MKRWIKPLTIAVWILLLVLNIADIWSTHHLLSTLQGAREANPVTGWLIDHGLMEVAKLSIVAAIGVCCIRTKNPGRYLTAIVGLTAFYAFVVIHNVSYMA